MKESSGLLFAKPSFLEGVARTRDIAGTFDSYNDSPTAEEADWVARASDWYAVGAVLLASIQRYASKAGYQVGHASQPRPR